MQKLNNWLLCALLHKLAERMDAGSPEDERSYLKDRHPVNDIVVYVWSCNIPRVSVCGVPRDVKMHPR